MKKVNWLFTVAFLFATQIILAQSGTIKGRVVSDTNTPLDDINIALSTTSLGSQTMSDGTFEITNVPEGTYTLVISAVGYLSQQIGVKVTSNQTQEVSDIILIKSIQSLDEVMVNGERANKFSRKTSEVVSKLSLKNIENSQVYNTISSELIKDQVVTNFDDALNSVTGLDRLWESTGRGNDGAGYFALRGFEAQPNFSNGLPALNFGSPDPINIEKIEVIKGPSGTLFGGPLTNYGGIINVTTKKPYQGFGGEVSYTTGTYGLNRVTADVNTNLDAAGKYLLRVTSAYEYRGSWQDAGFQKSFFVAPTLSYQASDKLSFLVMAEFNDAEQTNTPLLFLNRSAPSAVLNSDDVGIDRDRSFTSNDLTIESPTFNLQAQANYQISDQWSSQTAVSRSFAESKGYYSFLFDIDGQFNFSQSIRNENFSVGTTNIQQNFRGDFKIGQVRNRVIAGFDYYNQSTTNNSDSGFVFTGIFRPDGTAVGRAPDGSVPNVPLNRASVDAAIAQNMAANPDVVVNNIKTNQHIYGFYASDQVDFFPEDSKQQLSAIAGLRVDIFDNEGNTFDDEDDYDQTAVSPKFGLIYQPIKDKLSLFGNYQNSFRNIAPEVSPTGETLNFDPEQGNQLEFGIKANLFNDKLSIVTSYYDIQVKDRVFSNIILDDAGAPLGSVSIQGGEVESKGFEIEVIANPIPGLNIIAGYSHNDSEILVSTNNPGPFDEVGRRPDTAGPEDLANFWASYTFQESSALKGFGLGAGFNYAGDRNTLDSSITDTFIIPSYTVVNTSVFYQHKNYRVSLKLNNALDETYFRGWSTLNAQQPRSLLASISYKF